VWAPSKDIDPENLPIRIDEKLYDEIVVDPMTNDIYPGKPWFIYFYSRKCHFCQEFKAEFEDLANRINDMARFGMIDSPNNEFIKETFNLKAYPTIVLIYDGMVYEYEGMRTFESLRAFIKQDHIYIEKQYEIPPHIGQIGLWMKYLERDLPKYEPHMDKIYKPLGLNEKFSLMEKFMFLAAAVAVLIVLSLFVMMCCCCCRKKKPAQPARERLSATRVDAHLRGWQAPLWSLPMCAAACTVS